MAEFSADGTILASGGVDKIVCLWHTNKVTGNGQNDVIDPTEMETRHESNVRCLALTSDIDRLFSGEDKGKVFVHDIETLVEFLCIFSLIA